MGKHSLKKKGRPLTGEGDNPSLLDARVGSGYEVQLLCGGGNVPTFIIHVYPENGGLILRSYCYPACDYRGAVSFMNGVADGKYKI